MAVLPHRHLLQKTSRHQPASPDFEPGTDFVYGKTDLGVYWGSGNWEGLESQRLLTLEYTPFCSPELLDSEQPLKELSDLAHYRLLHEFSYEKWKAWLSHAGANEVRFKRGSIFEDTNLLIHAAIDGKGGRALRPGDGSGTPGKR
ncbi:MAG: LysR substrate-binding domain-containing protein [bacterium]